jgi:hypothetical protein
LFLPISHHCRQWCSSGSQTQTFWKTQIDNLHSMSIVEDYLITIFTKTSRSSRYQNKETVGLLLWIPRIADDGAFPVLDSEIYDSQACSSKNSNNSQRWCPWFVSWWDGQRSSAIVVFWCSKMMIFAIVVVWVELLISTNSASSCKPIAGGHDTKELTFQVTNTVYFCLQRKSIFLLKDTNRHKERTNRYKERTNAVQRVTPRLYRGTREKGG